MLPETRGRRIATSAQSGSLADAQTAPHR